MRSTVSRFPIQKLEDSTYNFKNAVLIKINYNYIYFHLQKLQLSLLVIDATLQELQYALKNSARAKCVPLFLLFLLYFEVFSLSILLEYSQIFKIVCTSSKFNTFYFS